MHARSPAQQAARAALALIAPAAPYLITPVGMAAVDPPAATQPAPAPESVAAAQSPSGSDPWRVELTTWIWATALNGDVTLGDRTANIDASFGDVLEASDSILSFSGRLEVGKGRFGGFVDAWYARLGAEDQSGPGGATDIDVVNEELIADFGLMYRAGTWEPSGEAAKNPHDITLDLYGGARYSYLRLELDPASLPERSRNKGWVDPIIGAKVTAPISERWRFMATGDVGGFGVSSDFTWSLTAVFGYDFHVFDHPASVYMGYRAIGQDFTHEAGGADEFTWDVVQHGPILGFSIFF